MTASMETMLAQEALSFTPRSGSFDLAKLAAGIARIGFSFQDEARPERFVITSDAESRDAFRAARKENPEGPFPLVVNVEARPDEIMVWPAVYDPELKDLSRQVVEWILATWRCDVANEFGTDLETLPPPG